MWNLKQAGQAFDSSATRLFRLITDWIVKLLVPLAVVALMMGVARVFLDLWHVFKSPDISAGFDTIVTDILSMFVVIELLKSIVEYFEAHRIKLTFILDAAVVFLLREAMIGLYRHNLDGGQLVGIAVLLLVLGAFRVAAVRYPPQVPHVAADAR
ncbi:MAG: phosphate-starvation-inducible PsiE family protein [Anaeromyxobacteraceae bacterium]|nr:phosphate-starvation-inducible PsiE family protein [Anaeromyxobacteraceae bacterium]